MHPKIGICIPNYNGQLTIKRCIGSAVSQRGPFSVEVFVVDDGSTDESPAILKNLAKQYENLNVFFQVHGERGIARKRSIDEAIRSQCDYLFFVDSDMSLEKGLVSKCFEQINRESCKALVVREKPYSSFKNYASQVKVFEREIINHHQGPIQRSSVEAARFWEADSYITCGGINPAQIAFEEIQPTLRIIEKGEKVGRVAQLGLFHDEGHITFRNLIQKKTYYFSKIHKTLDSEEKGLMKAIRCWYFFRPYLYTKKTISKALRTPQLYCGVLCMYSILSFLSVGLFIGQKLSTKNESNPSF